LQIAIVTIARRLMGPPPTHRAASLRAYLTLARRLIGRSAPAALYAIQAGAATLGAILVTSMAHLSNGYWAPMTSLLVIKPDLRQTVSRGFERALGTLAGAGIATLAAATLRPEVSMSAVLSVLFAAAAYTVQRANYAAFTASVTAYVVFLLAMTGLPEPANALHRIVATLVGGAVALLVGAVTSAIASMYGRFRMARSQTAR
jgi:uncharacterized membrane protein YccC